MSKYFSFVYSVSDGISDGIRNLLSWRVSENYQQDKDIEEKEEEKEDEKDFVLPGGTYVVVDYGSQHLGKPIRQTTIQIPNN